MTRIVAAAVTYRDDNKALVLSVPAPGRHHHVMAKARDCGFDVAQELEQGFITDSGRFVGREEALTIATAAGQIVLKHGNDRILFSEDLW